MIHRGFNRDKGPSNSRNIRSNRVSSETLLSSRESKLGESKAICSGKKIVDSCGSGRYLFRKIKKIAQNDNAKSSRCSTIFACTFYDFIFLFKVKYEHRCC